MNSPVYVKQVLTTLLVATACAVAMPAKASDQMNAHSKDNLFATVGSQGLSLGYGKRFSERWGGRVFLNSGIKGDVDDLKYNEQKYDGEAKVGPGLGVFADLYPIRDSGFRLTGGLLLGENKLEEMKAKPRNGTYTYNGKAYSAAAVGKTGGEVKYASVAPYLGVGWDSPQMASRWRFVADLGVKYLGEAEAKLTASGAANNAALRRDLAAENKKIDDTTYAVVATVGVSMAF